MTGISPGILAAAGVGVVQDFESTAIAEGNTTSSTTSHVLTLPTGIISGNIIFGFVSLPDDGIGFSWPAGWTELAENGAGGGSGSVGYRIADGTEGSTITVTLDTASLGVWATILVTGSKETAPEINTVELDSGTGIDPGSLTPSWGTKENLWFAIMLSDGNIGSGPTSPTNYTEIMERRNAQGSIVVAERLLSAASENPGQFSTSNSKFHIAWTLAIEPPD